eukprot:scaffold70781_cov73-Phaeocystis_antarctica.AAC.4
MGNAEGAAEAVEVRSIDSRGLAIPVAQLHLWHCYTCGSSSMAVPSMATPVAQLYQQHGYTCRTAVVPCAVMQPFHT